MKQQLADIKRLGSVNELLQYESERKRRFSFRMTLFSYLLVMAVAGIAVIYAASYYFSAKLTQDHTLNYYNEYVYQMGNSLNLKLSNTDRFLNAILRNENIQEIMDAFPITRRSSRKNSKASSPINKSSIKT